MDAFHTDYLVGGDRNEGPPDYDSVSRHEKTRENGDLYSYIDDEGKIIGGAVLFPGSDTVYVGRIYISPSCHRKVFGISLMKDIE